MVELLTISLMPYTSAASKPVHVLDTWNLFCPSVPPPDVSSQDKVNSPELTKSGTIVDKSTINLLSVLLSTVDESEA